MTNNQDSVQGDQVMGDKIVVGDVASSIMAVGKGSQVIIQSAHRTVEEARRQKQYEREMLAEAVARLAGELAPKDDQRTPEGNPYLSINTFRLEHTAVFSGRDREISEVAEQLSRHRCVVLRGENRVGKSSFLQAGLIPALVSNEHLPLYFHVSSRSESLVEDIWHELLPDLPVRSDGEKDGLSGQRLHSVLRSAADVLPEGKHLFVIIDQFEAFFELDEAIQDEFIREIGSSLQDTVPRVRWVLAMRSDADPFDLAKDVPGLVDNRYKLGKLSRHAARRAIIEPAQQVGLAIDEDLQSVLLDDLGGQQIDPSVLQQVCYALVEGLPPGGNRLMLSGYEEMGGVAGVMSGYLNDRLGEFLETEKDAAWLMLYVLTRGPEGRESIPGSVSRVAVNDIADAQMESTLLHLEQDYLIRCEGDRYRLASEHFQPGIIDWYVEWKTRWTIGERSRAALRRQGRIIRLSAARGLPGGFIGFGLACLFSFIWGATGGEFRGAAWLIALGSGAYLYIAIIGGLIGLLLILTIDLSNDIFGDPHRKIWRYLANGLSGAVLIALLVAYNTLLSLSFSEANLSVLLPDLREGAIWGLVTGVGITWVLRREKRSVMLALGEIGGISVLGGVLLILIETLGWGTAFSLHLLEAPLNIIQLGLAGAVLPAAMLLTAYLPRLWPEQLAFPFVEGAQ